MQRGAQMEPVPAGLAARGGGGGLPTAVAGTRALPQRRRRGALAGPAVRSPQPPEGAGGGGRSQS